MFAAGQPNRHFCDLTQLNASIECMAVEEGLYSSTQLHRLDDTTAGISSWSEFLIQWLMTKQVPNSI